MSQGDQSGEKIKVGVSSCLLGEKVLWTCPNKLYRFLCWDSRSLRVG
jgi:hypothetical protein